MSVCEVYVVCLVSFTLSENRSAMHPTQLIGTPDCQIHSGTHRY